MTTFPYKRVPGRVGSGQVSSSVYTVPKGATEVLEGVSGAPQHSRTAAFRSALGRSSFASRILRACSLRLWKTIATSAWRVVHGSDQGATLRCAASAARCFGPGDCGDGTLLHRRAGLQEDRPGRQSVSLRVGRRRPEQDGGTAARSRSPGGVAGRSARVRRITWHSTPAVMQACRSRRISTKSSATDTSEIKDRNYFHSIYTRCPGGISSRVRGYGGRRLLT